MLLRTTVALAAFFSFAGSAQAAVSSNWAGYAASRSHVHFRRVSGSWVVPTGSCTAGSVGFSAPWIGLGGFSRRSRALEQTGTEFDCDRAGRPHYSAWYELVPAGSVDIHVGIRPGDKISASVEVRGTRVQIQFRNLTTGRSFSRTSAMRSPDTTSAEWIMEAPAACGASGSCRVLPLSNFGTVGFTHAKATTVGGHTGTIPDPAWAATSITLKGGDSAVPSALIDQGSAFSVVFQAGSQSNPPPTFPS